MRDRDLFLIDVRNIFGMFLKLRSYRIKDD